MHIELYFIVIRALMYVKMKFSNLKQAQCRVFHGPVCLIVQ